MVLARDEFVRTTERLEARVQRLSPLALDHPEDDADERAAITLLLSSAFERFLREAMRQFVDSLPSRVASFHSLPRVVRETHYEGGAKALERAAKQDTKAIKAGHRSRYEQADELLLRLASTAASGYSLIWEAFSITDSNAGPDVVRALLRRVAIEKPWETLVSNIPEADYAVPPGPARAGKLNATLDELRQARNRCAHALASTSVPPWSLLQEFASALKATAIGYSSTLEARLQSLGAPPEPGNSGSKN